MIRTTPTTTTGRPSLKSKFFSTIAVAATLGLLAGCAGGSPEPAEPDAGSSTGGNEFSAMLPDSIRESGELIVGVTATYRPYEYMDEDGSTIIGANVDVLNRVAELLELDLVWENTAEFGSLLPGIQSGRYDAAVIFEDTIERQAVVDLVDFYEAGNTFLGEKGDASDPTVVCGATVAVGTGNAADLVSGDINEEICGSQGLPDIQFQNFANTDSQFVALSSGRVDFMLTGDAVVAVFVEEHDGFSARTPVYAAKPVGIAVAKNGLADALQAALQKLVDDGVVREIFKEWGVEHQVVDEVIVNFQG